MKRSTPHGLPEAAQIERLLGGPVEQASVVLACRSFCEYDKGGPGEYGCGGLAAVRRALSAGTIGAKALLPIAGKEPGSPRKVAALIDRLCETCSFKPDGCDFMAEPLIPDATPCGGYRLLLAMIDAGLLADSSKGPEIP